MFGRITGSDSLDTLVRVGIAKNSGEPQCTMVVLHDFRPCVSDELYVHRGQIVHMLFQVGHVMRLCEYFQARRLFYRENYFYIKRLRRRWSWMRN